MDLMVKQLLIWLVLREKIKTLRQQQKWTGDSLTGLRRCQKDYGNVPKAEFKRVTAAAEKHLKEMSGEENLLRKRLTMVNLEIMKYIGMDK